MWHTHDKFWLFALVQEYVIKIFQLLLHYKYNCTSNIAMESISQKLKWKIILCTVYKAVPSAGWECAWRNRPQFTLYYCSSGSLHPKSSHIGTKERLYRCFAWY